MVDADDHDTVAEGLRDERPEGADLEAKKWQADIASRLFGAPASPVRIGRYLVHDKIGDGAMGVVYAATDPELDRPVAIKLLRSDARLPPGATEEWLAEEAKTLARLSHPNVLAIYDVGKHDGKVFMAMELITGATLRQWMDAERSTAEVVDLFAQAAQGLAAAHEAGLVHRDFKPANVLIGEDGRVRVSDFGIAWHLDRAPASGEMETERGSGDPVVTHGRAGTPAYMAPEQFLGDAVDGRTDQFGFCVALHEAVYGRRPFAGSSRATLAANVIAGRRSTDSDRAPPPDWLDALIRRGLSVDPDDRYPTMQALLEGLRRPNAAPRSRWKMGAAATIGAAGIVVAAWSTQGSYSPCSDGATKLAGVWNGPIATRISEAFGATGLPYAEDSYQRVHQLVDAYGDRWIDANARACEGVSDAIVVRRMHCLQSRLLELGSLCELLAGADAATVEHSVSSVGSMVGPDECLYVGGDIAAAPDEARAEEAAQLRWTVARAKVMGDAGHPREGLELARSAVVDAQDLRDRALEAEALLVLGSIERILMGLDSHHDAESTIYKAILAAEAAHRPDLTARALVEYVDVAESLGQLDRLAQWEQRAREAVAVVGNPPALVGRIEYTMAMVHDARRDPVAAGEAAERAREAFLNGDASNRRHLASVYNFQGELTFERGQYAAALPYYERALDVVLEELGPHHAWTANAYGNAAEVYFKLGQYPEALAQFEQALAIRRRVFGERSVWTVHGMAHVGDVQLELGRIDEAIETYGEALRIRRELRVLAGDRPASSESKLSIYRDIQAWDQEQWLHHGLALAYAERGEYERALTHARTIESPVMPEDRHHTDLIGRMDIEGRILLLAGQPSAADESLRAALTKMREWYGDTDPTPAWPLAALGMVALANDQPTLARDYLQRALKRASDWTGAHPRALGDIRFALATTLWRLDEDRARAMVLASEAHDDYTRAANARPDDLAKVRAWLTEAAASTPRSAEEGR